MKKEDSKPHPVFSNYVCYRDGRIYSLIKNRFLCQSSTRGYGYLAFDAYVGDGSRVFKRYTAHRFIAETFLGMSDLIVNHKDGNKRNNNVDNLEWTTYSKNVKHAYDTGLARSRSGEKCHTSKYSEDTMLTAITLINAGFTAQKTAKLLGMHKTNLSYVTRGKSWKHLNYLLEKTNG